MATYKKLVIFLKAFRNPFNMEESLKNCNFVLQNFTTKKLKIKWVKDFSTYQLLLTNQ